jgi:hypothetical protein
MLGGICAIARINDTTIFRRVKLGRLRPSSPRRTRSDRGLPNGQCRICRHARRFEIELALAGGASCKAVGEKFDVQKDAVWRHWRQHVDEARKRRLVIGPVSLREAADRAAQEGIGLIDALALIRSSLMEQFQRVTAAGDARATALVSSRLLEALRLAASLTGELRASGGTSITNNILLASSPAFAELQSMLLTRLAPYPEARQSVLAGLRELDARLGGGMPNALPGPSQAIPGPVIDAEPAPEETAA